MDKKRLVLVDGYNFFFRAYFALKNIKKRSDGLAVNGVYGFTRMLMNLIIELKSTHIAVVFDTGNRTFRNELYEDYKANRPPVPEDMKPQFPIIREVVEVLNIKTIEKNGYEADDVIATLAKKAEKDGYEVWIISSDKDLMQLVNENIFLYETKDAKKIGVEEVKEKWGVKPEQLLGVLSLMGDSSDNVPGVPSIGEKTAVELMNTFGSLDNLIENVNDIKQEKRKRAIVENMDKLLLSKKLISLCDDVDLGVDIDELTFKNFDLIKFKDFLYRMEFNSIAKEIEKIFSVENDVLPSGGENNSRYKKITDIKTLNEVCAELVKNNDRLEIELSNNFVDDFNSITSICFDDVSKNLVFYVCICDDNEKYDLFDGGNVKNDCLLLHDVLNILKPVFENDKLLKISYDVKKQIRILRRYSIDIVNYDDISVMSYLLDNGKYRHNLSGIIENYLMNNAEIKMNNLEKNNTVLEQYDKGKDLAQLTDNIFNFNCFKIDVFGIIHEILSGRLKEDENTELKKLYDEVENPLVKVLADMEFVGVKIDIGELKKLSNYFSIELLRLEENIYKTAGVEFNINSPKQLSEILFNKMNLPPVKKANKSGGYSTDVEILETLYQMGFDIAGDVLEYRHYTKLKNTYTDTLQKLIDKDSRVHTTYSNTYVITGRLSSNNPNLQNIPIRTDDGEKIRKTFVAKSGYSFIGVDYSQIELRILAQYAHVVKLIESFKNNLDIHTETAKTVFKTDEITPEMRRMAKAINFSIVYGTTQYGLAKRLDMSNSDAKNYMNSYFNLYPEIKDYMENIKFFANKNGFVKTMFGRVCYIDLINSKEPQKSFLERLAINAPIQGTGADIIKKAMIGVYNGIKNYDAKIILQIHDELLIEVKNDCLEEVKQIVKDTMENVVTFDIKLPVELKTGTNWSEVH